MVVELQIERRNQLLQSPPTLKPAAIAECFSCHWVISDVFNLTKSRRCIFKMYNTSDGAFIPAIHRIDSLGEFSTARFVNAASVDLNISTTLVLFFDYATGVVDFRITSFLFSYPRSNGQVLKGNLILALSVR